VLINSKQYSTHLLFFLSFFLRNINNCLWYQNNNKRPFTPGSLRTEAVTLLWTVSTFLCEQLLFWLPSHPHASSYFCLPFSIQVFCCSATWKHSSVMNSNLAFFEIIGDFLSWALWIVNWIEWNLNLFLSNCILVSLFDQVCFTVFWTSD